MSKNVVILSFSGRKGGNCTAINDYIKYIYKQTNVRSFVIENKVFPPCGECNYECLKENTECPQLTDHQRRIMDSVIESDLVYFVVPNYCGYPCSNYFAFNERSVGYFNMSRSLMEKYMTIQKRFIIVSNSEENFTEAMQQQVNDRPDILFLKTSKYQKQSIAGDLLTSEAAKADLWAFLAQDTSLL